MLGADGRLYLIPSNAPSVLQFDAVAQQTPVAALADRPSLPPHQSAAASGALECPGAPAAPPQTQGRQRRGIGHSRTTVEGLIIASCQRAGNNYNRYKVLLLRYLLIADLGHSRGRN